MRSKKITSEKNFYFTILELLKEGKRPSKISKELGISKQKIYYYTTILKNLGFIEKKGYGIWEVKRSKKIDLEHALNWRGKKIRGHAFIWKVKPEKKFNWEEILKRNNIHYSLVRGYIPRIIINKNKIWLSRNSIIIYENRSFYGKNAFESRKYAVWGLKSVLDILQKKLRINLGKYLFTVSREHYGMIKNELARQINNNGEKLIVRDDLDGEWLWIDDSEGMLGELETGGKGITKDRAGLNLEVQNWYNDMKKYNFKVTPSFLMENIYKLAENQKFQSENLKEFAIALNKHIPVYEGMGKELSNFRKSNELQAELLAKTISQMRESFEEQIIRLQEEIKNLRK